MVNDKQLWKDFRPNWILTRYHKIISNPTWIIGIFYTYLTWLIWPISILTNLNLLWLSSQTKLIRAPTENWTYYTIFCLPSSLTITPRRSVQDWSCKNKTLFRKWYFVLTIARKKILAFKKNTKLMPTDPDALQLKLNAEKIKQQKCLLLQG